MSFSFPSFTNKKLIAIIFLFVFISIFLIQNYLFIKQDRPTGFTDSHLISAAIFYDKLVLKNDNMISQISYPPLLYLISTLSFRINGVSVQGARLPVSFFAIIFLLAMFGIGYKLGGYYSGAAVMALAASSPHILNYSRHFFPGFPQTALTALAFYLLLRSEGYKHRTPSILMGIAIALSFLIKWSTAFFLIIPVLWFFVPIIIKPGKYLNQYLVFIITALFAILGTVWYFRNAPLPSFSPDYKWLRHFILFIILPSAVCLTTMFIVEKRFKKDEEYSSSPFRKLINFTLMGVVFCVIALPWYYWNAAGMVFKFLSVSQDFIRFQDKTVFLMDFIRTSFSLFPVFLIFSIIGVFVVLFTYKQDFYRNLILPVNTIFIILLMLKILCPGNRYLLSIVIFTSALGGFWVSKARKLRGIFTAFILLVSLISILSWMIFPCIPKKALPVETPVMRVADYPVFPVTESLVLVQSQPVITSKAQEEVRPLIDYLFADPVNPCNRIMMIEVGTFREKNFDSEFLKFEIFRLTGKLQTDYEWNWEVFQRLPQVENSSKYPAFEPEDLDDKIVDRINNDTTDTGAAITRHFSGETLTMLRNEKNTSTKSSLKKKVIMEFNRLLSGSSLIKEKNIADLINRMESGTPAGQGKGNIVLLNRRILENIYDSDIRKKFRRDHRLENACNTVDCIVVMYDSYSSPAPAIEEMKKLFPGQIYDSKTFVVGNIHHIEAMKINNRGND